MPKKRITVISPLTRKTISSHTDTNTDHICDYCGKTISNHADTNKDHLCDICGDVISNHEDTNKDHVCDICGKTISNHTDADPKDHICDYCGKTINNHADEDKDHVCDYCEKAISNHEDTDKDHICEYCGKVISNHNGVLVEGTAATLESTGFKSYYKCDCGKLFEDATCKVEITDLDAWKAQGGNGYIAKLEEEPTSPQTGDNSHMTLWVMLLALSSMGLCACLVLGKKRKNVQ